MGLSEVSKDRFADGFEFYLSRLEDSGSLALKMILNFLERDPSVALLSDGAIALF